MKKIGIVTHYYASTNYGGNLQAYALCQAIRGLDFDAKQISLVLDFASSKLKTKENSLFKRVLRGKVSEFIPKVIDRLRARLARKHIRAYSQQRKTAFVSFNLDLIPHTEEIYKESSISACLDEFDCFVTGSDQVWNPLSYKPSFFLSFVPSEKRKISYAASVATETLSEEQASVFKEHLKDFHAISVREDSAVDLIQPLAPVPVKHTLDPTLLLEASDWDAVCSERIIPEDYVFCYFLGYNQKERKLAKQYAKKHNLKLVTIPMINYGLSVADVGFGDVKLSNASVQDFISLIKHAKRVFTDSFHASVFSIIYNTPFFVFQRGKSGEMSSRITSLLSLFSLEERFCTYDKSSLSYLEQLDGEGLHPSYEKYNEKKKESIAFLTENLG